MDIRDIYYKFERDIYRIGNHHIIIQINEKTCNYIKNIFKTKRNQHIHVFEVFPLSVKNWINMLINEADKSPYNKLIFHISKYTRDYERVLTDDFRKLDGKILINISIDPNTVMFTCDKGLNEKYELYVNYQMIKFSSDQYKLSLNIYTCIKKLEIPYNGFYRYSEGAFETQLQRKDPETFKDRIIQNFKKYTPKGILKGFKDDKDIWDFIMASKEIDS